MEESNRMKKILWNAIVYSFFLACIGIFAGFIGYGKGGFTNQLFKEQFWSYGFVGVAGILIIYILSMAEYTRGRDEKYGNSLYFNDSGEKPSPEFGFLKMSPLKLFLLFFIIFSIFSLVATLQKLNYFGIGKLGQQFTFLDGQLYNWFLVVTCENAGIAGLIALSTFVLRRIANKNLWSTIEFKLIAGTLAVVLFMLYGFINHQLRYSNSEDTLLTVAGFWGLLGLITVITGSFIPAYILHGLNNTFTDFINNKLVSDFFVVSVVIFIISLIVFYYLLFLRRKTGDIEIGK